MLQTVKTDQVSLEKVCEKMQHFRKYILCIV